MSVKVDDNTVGKKSTYLLSDFGAIVVQYECTIGQAGLCGSMQGCCGTDAHGGDRHPQESRGRCKLTAWARPLADVLRVGRGYASHDDVRADQKCQKPVQSPGKMLLLQINIHGHHIDYLTHCF